MIDFSNYRFRCSQLSLLMTGTIGATAKQLQEIEELENEKKTGLNVNGNKIKFTPTKAEKLSDLKKKRDDRTLPKTMQSELRKIYRMEKYSRNFPYTNAYIQKGLQVEEEAITFYQSWRNAKGIKTFFAKNEERLNNKHFSGEPDLKPVKVLEGDYKGLRCGFDIKNSYDLSTFPFPSDPLIEQYECQMQGYIDLEKADMWLTVFCLINATEQAVHNEKLKWMYALTTQKHGNPDSNPDHPYYLEYVSKCKEVEKMMIYDYNRFKEINPFHNMEITKEEWFDNGYDIPYQDRIVEKVSMRDDSKIAEIKERCEIGRNYLTELQKQDEQKLVLV